VFGLRGRCITASVKHLAQRSSIHAIVGADGDDPSPWFSAIPCLPNGDIHALADYLKDDPSARFFGGMHHAFASVHAGWELARRFPQRFQGKEWVGSGQVPDASSFINGSIPSSTPRNTSAVRFMLFPSYYGTGNWTLMAST
jgi:hypothetical protein